MYLKTYESIIVSEIKKHMYKDNTVLCTSNTNCFTIFVHIETLGEKSIQSCVYHIVPRPRK